MIALISAYLYLTAPDVQRIVVVYQRDGVTVSSAGYVRDCAKTAAVIAETMNGSKGVCG